MAVSRNSPAKKKAGVKNQLFLLLAFWSGSFSKLSCKEKSWSGKPTFSFTGFWKWQFLETALHIKWLTCPRQATHLTCGLPRAYRFYVFYRIYPFWKMPVRPVYKRLSGKTQSGKFSKVGWQILESWVANSRKLGGKFSKVVESVENLLNLKNGFKSGFFEFQSGKFSKVITILRVAQNCECWKAVESIHIA